MLKVFIGWDSREQEAYDVCVHSLKKHSSVELDIQPIVRSVLIDTKEYFREQPEQAATEFAYTRFLTPYLSDYKGWSLFIDCDFLFTKDVAKLFDCRANNYAAMCVQHDYIPKSETKMDGQKQVSYPRKNWSSCILWNCSHPANRILTPYVVSTQTGAYLHRFQFIPDHEVGDLPLEWNWLEGEYDKPETPPAVVHFTNGGPWFENCQDVDYADLWNQSLEETKES
tara:strand:+ start:1708 stop:2385 length:678 start_codon:yes stop_codon:yes gene_type:complete